MPFGQDLYFGKEDLGVGLGDAQSADWKVAVLDHEEGGLRQTPFEVVVLLGFVPAAELTKYDVTVCAMMELPQKRDVVRRRGSRTQLEMSQSQKFGPNMR